MTLRMAGFNDEVTDCTACGRTELKGTVVIVDGDGVEHGRYGTTCASYVLAPHGGGKVTRIAALAVEMHRRQNVKDDLREALKRYAAGDVVGARWFVQEARKLGLHRSDELAAADKIESQER